MIELPAVDNHLFPQANRAAISRFWLRYWLLFFVFLPWMLVRQLFNVCRQAAGAVWIWNREIALFDGSLRIVCMNSPLSFAINAVFGERFTAIHFEDVLIDPGPVFGGKRLTRYLRRLPAPVRAVFATHAHEEHVANAVLSSQLTGVPIYGTQITLDAIRRPERLSWMRRTFVGQPPPGADADLRPIGSHLNTPGASLLVIESPGHCSGHVSLYDPARGILFAGDSFLHAVFTSPNQEVSGKEWIATLERYAALEIKTMVGTHGQVYSIDPGIGRLPFIVERRAPQEMIEEKLGFLRWTERVVAEGERRSLPYGVIEACLFPWRSWWSWQNWFNDEAGRLFSGGEFSRTHFVRSMSRSPERVPARFPLFVRLARRLARSGSPKKF